MHISPHKISLQIEVEVASDAQPYLRHQIEAVIRQLLPGSPLQVSLETIEGSRLELRFLGQPEVWWNGQKLTLRQRFQELLAVMALHPNGLSSEQISLCVYGDHGNSGCSRIELARLRQMVPFESRPYRLVGVEADFLQLREHLYAGRVQKALELYRGPLLAHSQAPAIVAARVDLEEALRRAVLISSDPNHLWALANTLKDDLEIWEIALDYLPPYDPRRGLAEAQCGRITGEWKVA